MKKNITTAIILLVVIVAIVFGFIEYKKSHSIQQSVLDTFAQCVAEKKVTMYGAEWCPHCQREKALFGSSFKYVPYVECPENTQLCLDKGITGYPTWMDSNGKKYEGEQGLEGIAKISNCALPTR